jgi:hypothetical protein
MIFTDKTHLWAQDENELHAFALKIGLKREWFQSSKATYPHYDLTTERAGKRAISAGAVLVSKKALVLMMRGSLAYGGIIKTGTVLCGENSALDFPFATFPMEERGG